MGPLQLQLSSFLLTLLSHLLLPHGGAAAVITCPAASCSPTSPPVEFPFRLRSRRQVNLQCGYPGFGLSCNNRTHTVLNLPSSGDFSVQDIDYRNQTIWLTDPDSCLPRRLLNFSLTSSSPFAPQFPRQFTFLNCSTNNSIESVLPMISWVSCLNLDGNSGGYRVGYVPTVFMMESSDPFLHGCGVISTVLVPVASEHASDLHDGIRLMWSEPACGSCLARGGTCGLEDGSGMVVGCKTNPSKGLPRSAKYGIIVGLGIPGLLCLIGFTCYLGGLITTYRQRRRHPDPELSMTTIPEPNAQRHGLDGPTIASYPKTLIGESRRLPKPNDNTCAICLCEYQSNETLRTIPECSHYFHVDCIDEWLKMNGTCPLCRNSPIESASITPSESVSSASSSRVLAW